MGAIVDMRQEMAEEDSGHTWKMCKIWETYRNDSEEELKRHQLAIKKIAEKCQGNVEMHDAAVREITGLVRDSGREIWLKGGADEASGEVVDSGTTAEGSEAYGEADVQGPPGPWWEIPAGHEVSRGGETFLPRFSGRTITLVGDEVDITDGSARVDPPGLGYEEGEEPMKWNLLYCDRRDLVLENNHVGEERNTWLFRGVQ